MSLVDRWWCRYHGTSGFYWLEKGSAVRRCGVMEADGGQCAFPVRREAAMDQMATHLGLAGIDSMLFRALGGRNQ